MVCHDDWGSFNTPSLPSWQSRIRIFPSSCGKSWHAYGLTLQCVAYKFRRGASTLRTSVSQIPAQAAANPHSGPHFDGYGHLRQAGPWILVFDPLGFNFRGESCELCGTLLMDFEEDISKYYRSTMDRQFLLTHHLCGRQRQILHLTHKSCRRLNQDATL